jgi:TIR domain-containing protein
MTEIVEVYPPSPLFFLSYARSETNDPNILRRDRDRHVVKFFNDLSENVAWLVSRPAGSDPGFMDRSIRFGARWPSQLLDAVGTCQVLVALLSGPYLASQWCGMEWYGFSQRKVICHRAVDHQSAIIPVIWAPFPVELTPPEILAIQRFSPSGLPDVNIVAEYEENGVLGLIQTGNESYTGVVWRLAKSIADFCYTHNVEPRAFQPDEMRDAFRGRRS